jgi:hypothetical protein
MDGHHVAGEANSTVKISIPVNDHIAVLSPAQDDWPKLTRQNPDASPLLARAACIRGFADTVVYLVEKLLLPVAEMLEVLDAFLVEKCGPRYWVKTKLERFRPQR